LFFGFAEIQSTDRCKLTVSTIAPRLIAWVVSQIGLEFAINGGRLVK
jgi:hypothetical protein